MERRMSCLEGVNNLLKETQFSLVLVLEVLATGT